MPHLPKSRLTLLTACLLATSAYSQSDNSLKAAQAYLAGTRDLDTKTPDPKHLAEAQQHFAEAAALAPTRQDYALALTSLRDHRISDLVREAAHARLFGDPTHADSLLASARLIDPTNELILQHPATPPPIPTSFNIAPAPDLAFLPPIQIIPNAITTDLHLHADSRQDVTQATQAFGVKAIFDDSVTPQPLRFDLEQTTYDQAIPILLRTAHLFAVPIDTKTLLVLKDTQENRDRYERLVQETIYVPALTPEQLNELTNVIKNVFDIKQAVVSPAAGTLLLRAPAAALQAVNATLKDLLDGQAQVVMELKLITADRSNTHNIGVNLPTTIQAFSVYAEAQNVVNANQSILSTALSSGAITIPSGLSANAIILYEAAALLLSGLATDANFTNLLGVIGGGITTLGVSSIGTTAFNFALSFSDSRALDDITVRVGDRQTTTLRVGEKYPVTSSSYSSGITSAQTAALSGVTVGGVSAATLLAQASASAIPIITYEDLGITLKATPTVLKSGLISMHIDLKLEALTGASLDNIPILTSRNFVSDITVDDGTSALMVSSLSKSEEASLQGIPGLSEIPFLGKGSAETLRETSSSELVLLITPHLIRRRSNVIAGPRIAFYTSVPQDN